MKGRFLYLLGFLLLLLAILPFTRSRPAALPWHRDADRAFEAAERTTRTVVTFLFTDWCGVCKRMDLTTFADEALIAEMSDRYVWLRLNAETDAAGAEMRRRFGVTGYPTIMLLDESGEEIDRIPGYLPADRFREEVRSKTEGPDSFAQVRRRAIEGPEDSEAQYALASLYMQRRNMEQAGSRFRRVFELDPDNHNGRADASLYYYAETQAAMSRFELAMDTLEELLRRFPDSPYATEANLMRAEMLLQTGEAEEAMTLLRDFLASHPEHRAAPQIRNILDNSPF